MSLVITVPELRAICPTLMATDAALELLITSISCKVDVCLTGSYMDCPDLARAIKLNTICHFATLSSQSGQLTSKKYANGAAATFKNYVDGGRGLNASQFGESVLALDSAGCINAAFPASARQFIRTAGTAGSRDVGFY
ncbi:hypothetical protein NVP1210O_41 [Vibrio phage 1.210.O._10N.222.52.C2]|nr:hypothetical protein NVP1210O_41 [Vibrio phage 1.210.O._10N.222.52.C2]